MDPTSRGAVFLGIAACLGCSSDDLRPTEDDFGDTSETGETGETGDLEPSPGPHGPGCDEHWYSLDGLPVEQQGELPEFASLADTPSTARIEFSGPPPALAVPQSNMQPESLEPLSWEAFVAKFAQPTTGGWYIEEDLFRTPEKLHEDYLAYSLRAKGLDATKSASTLLGMQTDGIDDTWSGPRRIALTWCVGWVTQPQQSRQCGTAC